MKKLLVLSMAMLFAATSFAATQFGQNPAPGPITLDTGGPDAYGYRWIDSDGSGGPVYNWVDISTRGVQITTLADDNNVGPIPLGFQFPYYWYNVDHLWIGSNGYISFSSSANFAHPFDSIPSPAAPNDLIGILVGDLDFTEHSIIRPPACYYYTNNVDSFVVSWINVSEFSANHGFRDSTHTFQLILTKADSTIIFQYGENHGRFPSSGNLQDLIGIEDQVGRVGIEYLEDNLPSNHLWHDLLVIKFHPIPNPDFHFKDFGVLEGLNESSGADFIHINQPYTIKALVKNFGTLPDSNMTVRCQVRRGTTIIYNVLDSVALLSPGEQLWINFAPDFTPGEISTYKVTFTTTLTGDQNTGNNTVTLELDSYQLPQVLRFCDDLAEAGRAWNGDFSGFGVEYQLPEPMVITSGSFNLYTADSTAPCYYYIFGADSSGNPDLDNFLFADTVIITQGVSGWYDVPLANPLYVEANQKIFTVEIHARMSTMQFAMDQSVPLSHRGWEYTGGLSPDRERSLSDVMMRIAASPTGIDEGITPRSFSLSQNYPNPFNASTTIRFSLENPSNISIDIYNIAGQLVETIGGHFNAGANSIIWDASQIASGVYFYRINVGNSTETRKMVLLK